MSRYIDADALKTNINTAFWSEIEKVIDNAPSIDIVRCKKCIDFVYDEQYKCYGCANDNGLMGEINPDDFCSYGERKEGE